MKSEIAPAAGACAAAALVLLGLAGGCRPGGGEAAAEGEVQQRVEQEVLAETPYSGIEERERRVIRDPAEWERTWRLLTREREPESAPPPVAFGREMVIVAAMGRRPTGGYAIQVDSVVRSDDELVAAVTETAPGPGCMTTQAFTAPAIAVRVARVEGTVTFAETERTEECR